MVGRSKRHVALSGVVLFVLGLLGGCGSDGGMFGMGGLGGGGSAGGLGGGGSAGGPGGAGGVSVKIGWCAAETVDVGESTAPRDMDMAVDPLGNAIIVWWDYGGDQNVWSNRWTPDAGWGAAERIQVEDGPTLFPRVATDASGNAVAVWAQSDCASTYDIWSSRWTSTEGWSPAERIETEDGWASSPAIAIGSNGNAIAVWTQTDGTGVHAAWSNRWTHDSGWGTAERIQTSDQGARDAQVVVDSDGKAIATWRERNDDNVHELSLSQWTANDGWGTPERSDAPETVGEYHMALDPSGHALVVWSTGYGYGSGRDLWSARWTGAWQPAVQAVDDGYGTRDQKVVFDASGNAVATWRRGGRVWTGHWTPSDGWGELTKHQAVEAPSWSASPDVAVDPDGNAFLVWEEEDEVWWARWTPSVGWSDPERIESDDGYVSEPELKLDADGNAIAVWRHSAGFRLSRFDGTCTGDPGAGGAGGDGGASGAGGALVSDPCEGVVCPDTECRSGGACDPDDGSCAYATVADDGTACSEGACLAGGCGRIGAFACTEQGIRDAIAEGGGPHFFACDESTAVVLGEPIVIDNDVILDGEGELTLDGSATRSVFSVEAGRSVELRAIRVVAEHRFNGLIENNSGNLTLVDSTVEGVRSHDGPLTLTDTEVGRGGVDNYGVATLTRTRISAPDAHGSWGGGITNSRGTMTVTDSTISGSGGQGSDGGGVYNFSDSILIIENTTISGNTGRSAGAIYNRGTMTLTHSTVSNNTAVRGPSVFNLGALTVANSTVSGGDVLYECGSYTNGYGIGNWGTLIVTNSTLAANLFGGLDNRGEATVTNSVIDGGCVQYSHTPGFQADIETTSGGYNIVGGVDNCGFDDQTDLVGVSSAALALGPLTDNGGPTMTHALLPGSVAIDTIPALMCEATEDQRGEPRPSGGMCDAGAFEVQP